MGRFFVYVLDFDRVCGHSNFLDGQGGCFILIVILFSKY